MSDLNNYYEQVLSNGSLRTPDHAQRWSQAVLQTLGLNLQRSVKKSLGSALPEELNSQLYGVFWLLNFRNEEMSALDFQERVAKRAGNSDKLFARLPTVAVFGAVKTMVGDKVANQVADDLAPELKNLWQGA